MPRLTKSEAKSSFHLCTAMRKWVVKDDIHNSHQSSASFRPPMPYWAYGFESSQLTGSQTTRFYDSELGKWSNRPRACAKTCQDVGVGLIRPPVHICNSESYAMAYMNARQRLNDKTANLAETLSDGDKTIGTTISSLRNLMKAAQLSKSGNFAGALRALGHKGAPVKTASKAYLMGRFYAQPLMQDIQTAYEIATNPSSHVKTGIITGTGKGSTSLNTKVITIKKQYYGGPNDTLGTAGPAEMQVTGTNNCYVRLDYRVDNPWLAFLSVNGAFNLPLQAWNRTPLSFIADWGYNLSSFLQTLDPLIGMSPLGLSVSWKQENISMFKSTSPEISVSGEAGRQWYVYRQVALPGFWFLPTKGNGLNFGKGFTLLCMLGSMR